MDTTKEYQKMMIASSEIIENWNWDIGDNFIQITDEFIGENIEIVGYIPSDYPHIINSCSGMLYIQSPYNLKYDNLIPLPHQDQLQNMVEGEYWQLQYDMYHFMQTSYIDNQIAAEVFISMEQLWLAFVMDDKFNKKWDESEWN